MPHKRSNETSTPTFKRIVRIITPFVYILMFAVLTHFGIARPYYSDNTNLWWGLLHGFYADLNFFLSLFEPRHYAIYQAPNSGILYNLGFLSGIGIFSRFVLGKQMRSRE